MALMFSSRDWADELKCNDGRSTRVSSIKRTEIRYAGHGAGKPPRCEENTKTLSRAAPGS
jgi:hypothetical protein